jgi:secreted Zn-dependent insulinase-like peptidase
MRKQYAQISVSLTPKGLANVDEVLEYIFSYIRLLKSTGAQEWVWKESAALANMHFRFQEKQDPSGESAARPVN